MAPKEKGHDTAPPPWRLPSFSNLNRVYHPTQILSFTDRAMKAVALYDFDGNKSAEELTFKVGDILTVTNTSTDDGWWEGITAAGQEGIFPELYVQLLVSTSSVVRRRPHYYYHHLSSHATD